MSQSASQSASDSRDEEFFEFSSITTGSSNMMSHAEDIIFCGKLITLKNDHNRCDGINIRKELKYTETQPNSPKLSKFTRSCKSFDNHQLRRSLSTDCRPAGIRRYSSARSSERYDKTDQKVYKPRWYSMLFGFVSKIPPEMELRDMKNRLVRRTPTTMFAYNSDDGIILQSNDSNRHKSSWGLLNVLSCKYNANIDVTNAFRCMSRANMCDNTYARATCT